MTPARHIERLAAARNDEDSWKEWYRLDATRSDGMSR